MYNEPFPLQPVVADLMIGFADFPIFQVDLTMKTQAILSPFLYGNKYHLVV